MSCRGFFVLCHLLLDTLKQVKRYNSGDSIGNNNFSVNVLSDVAAIIQKVLNAVIGHRLTSGVGYAVFVEVITDFRHRCTIGIFLKSGKNER